MGEEIAEIGYLAGICQYDGTGWRKSNLLFGYNDTVAESVVDTNLGAGVQSLLGTVVPAGEVWVITAVSVRIDSASATSLYGLAVINSVEVPFISAVPPSSATWYVACCQVVLKEGDRMKWIATGITAGDDGYLRYSGYKMKLDM